MDHTTVWLRQQFGRKVFFPDRTTGEFTFPPSEVDNGDNFFVHGTPYQPVTTVPQVPIVTPSTSITDARPVFTSKKSAPVISLKVIQASMRRLPSGKVEFNQKSQTFIDIKEDTANVNYISSAVQNKWGSNYVLVTSDGLAIDDCSGATGRYYIYV